MLVIEEPPKLIKMHKGYDLTLFWKHPKTGYRVFIPNRDPK